MLSMQHRLRWNWGNQLTENIIVGFSSKSWQSTLNGSVSEDSQSLSVDSWATGLIDAMWLYRPKQRGSLLEERDIFLKPHLVVKLEEWWGDPASWVSAHSMSSSRPCRLGRCFPGPPTLDHRRCCTQHRRRCITRSSSRISPEKPFPSPSPPPPPPPLLWLLSMTHRGHHVTVANFWAAAKFEEEGGFRWSFQCTFGASAAAGPLKAAETRGWISTGGPPPRPRLGRLATSSYFQPHAKQGPRGLKGGARGVESWERGAGANGRSAKRGNRTVLDCVEPKVWVKEEADGDKKGEKSGQTVSKIVGPTYSCHRQLVSQRQPTSN